MIEKKITQNELGELLQRHLQGTALEPIAENRTYIRDPDGKHVAKQTIKRLCGIFQQAIEILKMSPTRDLSESIGKIRGAIAALQEYR